MTKIKVVYLIDTLMVGGAEKSLTDIAINNQDVESIFITIYEGNELAPLLEKNNIKVYQLNNTFRYGFSKVVNQLIPLIGEIKPDIIHSTLFRADIVARRLKKNNDFVLISSFVNNSYINERYSKLNLINKAKLYGCQLLDKWSASKVDLFVSNSETIKLSNSNALSVSKELIKVIYRGRFSKKFSEITNEEIQSLKSSLPIKHDVKILLNVSRLLDRKGQVDLLRSFKEIHKLHPKTVLLIAGEGSYRATLENEIKSLQLSDSVVLLGNRSDVHLLLKLADFFVFPSHYEGLPGALIEAMFAEKIIVCSDIGENKECVSEKEAVYFKKGVVSDLIEKLHLVIKNEEDYKEMAGKAKTTAIEKFELSSVVGQYNETYKQLIDNKK